MKIVIVGGAGGIGSSLAYNLLRTDTPYDVVLVDSRPNMITSHVMDLQDVLAFGGARSVRGGEPHDALDADVVVLSAAVPLRLNASRSVFLAENAALLDGIVDPLAAAGWGGILMVLTNPVDALLTRLQQRTGLDPRRIIGYTVNDGLRMRTGVARALDARPQDVETWVLGEHGEAQVPLYSRVRLRGEPVVLTDSQRAVADEYMTTWYSRHVALDSGRTSTWSSGAGAAALVEAVATGSGEPWPASVVLTGQYGIDGVGIGAPVRLGPRGVEEVLEWDLADEERSALRHAAERVRAAAASIGEPAADVAVAAGTGTGAR
ncbi:malate dehydrogenase [Pseudonocardia sp. McavD-2-B]|uniref:malate dehydrogenase n=1 Tax=Pseudonocardia sp. McavD-2-B TaxID=2954499 RepID=UPI0020969798|nr:hypothetical protein [Pseudonocardia sp. McavD-2-B]MCO7191461.1 hypothetical protein [Pseudonocardia sp. McavD-2-B]